MVCRAANRNPERDLFLTYVADNLDPGIPTVLAGDFNTIFNRSLDRCGSVAGDTSRESTANLTRLFEEACCEDIWRCLHPYSSGLTLSRADGSFSSRIDLIGCPLFWVPSVSVFDIVPCPFSDHCALVFSVSVPDVIPPGPGLWKLNVSILEEKEYFDVISNFWAQWKHRKAVYSSLAKWWEDGKARIKGLTISYCCRRSRLASQARDLLTRLLKRRVDVGCSSCLVPYMSVLEQLFKWDIDTARGAQVRSRVRWVEDGEVSSAFFFRLEKRRAADRWVAALREPDGSIVSSRSDLCASFASLYSSLSSASPPDSSAQDSLLANISSSLSCNQVDQCEGPLTLGECYNVLLGMTRRRAPGTDGLPMEFCVRFWKVLGQDLVDVLNTCYASASLSLSQRRRVIFLVFKRGDRPDARNWRPISLLNVDYKLASRVLAGRFLKVIHLVVSKDHTFGVPGRFIGENVALLRDVADYATLSNVPTAVLSLDQENAFDRVDWPFMLSTFSKMGFGPSFLRWIRLLYNGVQSCVNVNGYLPSFFVLSRGVCQSCPLSPLLYVSVSEVLAVNIRANPRIVGLSIPGSRVPLAPISLYADDTSLIVNYDDAILAVFDSYSQFEAAFRAKLNVSKSKGLLLGTWSGRRDPLVQLDWTSEKIKVLRVYVGPGDMEEADWRPRITGVENVLASWRQRALSFRGRAGY